MIITDLWAENVLKYATLDLTDIPERGLIAVSGDNESGKSSIGECICFALFGRTFSLPPADVVKVIRWGETRCTTKLDFVVSDGTKYRLTRFLDDGGNHGASLTKDGSESPMARGAEDVDSALRGLIGFSYAEFIESFYLAQREITTPHPHSVAVKAMAGVGVLEAVREGCEEEIEQIQVASDETQNQLTEVLGQLVELDLKPGYLDSLLDQKAGEEQRANAKRARIQELEEFSSSYDRPRASLVAAADRWTEAESNATYVQLQTQAADLDEGLNEIEAPCRQDERTMASFAELTAFAKEWQTRLGAFEAVRGRASQYGAHLGWLLSDESADADANEKPYAARQAELTRVTEQDRSSRGLARTLMGLSLVVALLLLGIWGLLALSPEAIEARSITEWAANNIPEWESRYSSWVPFGAGLFAVIAVAFGLRSSALTRRLRVHKDAAAKLARAEEEARRDMEGVGTLDDTPLPEAAAFLSQVGDETVSGPASEFVEGIGSPLVDAELHRQAKSTFAGLVADVDLSINEIKEDTSQAVSKLVSEVAAHGREVARLNDLIATERERVRKGDGLDGVITALQGKVEESAKRSHIRTLAIDLLNGACHYVSQRFNHDVRNLAGDTLPKFTNDRYEHLQIDETLKVKVFSNEKRDFMDLDEVSSGTQRQIMLAIRLALSQELINTAIRGPQMVFLDEPFAFFDERRSAGSLQVLPKVSEHITQVWVTSQTFPKEIAFDLHIACTPSQTEAPNVVRLTGEAGADEPETGGDADNPW